MTLARLMSVKEVAELLNVSPRFVYDHTANGDLRAVSLSHGVRRWLLEDVEAYVAEHRT